MKKTLILTFALILCAAAYLLFKGYFFEASSKRNNAVEMPASLQSKSPHPTPKNKPLESTAADVKQAVEGELAKNESPILACKPRWADLWKSDERDLLSDPDSVRSAFKNSTVFPARFAYALSYTDKALESESESESAKASEAESRVNLLLNLIAEQPNSKILNYFLVSQCNGERDNPLCVDDLFERATNNGTNNGAMWLQTAIFAAGNENTTGVVSALEQVIAAQEFNSYWAESIELFDEALLSIGIEHQQLRVVASIGYSAAVAIAPVQKLYQLCREQAQARADLAQVCIDAGKRMAFDSKTLLNQSIGYGLQKTVYKALGDTDNETRVSNLSNENLILPAHSIKASEMMMYDSNLLRYWFEQLKLFGEKEAIRLSTEEAIRLSSDPDYDPC